MIAGVVDGLFQEADLQKLDLSRKFFKKVDERAPTDIVDALWPEDGARPSSSISFKTSFSLAEGPDDISLAAKKIAESCFAHLKWSVCNVRYFHYAGGEHVVRHVDGNDKVCAAILYLNRDWKPEHSGELEIEIEGQVLAVAPIRGRVAYLGPDVVHGTRKVEEGDRNCIVFFYTNLEM